MKAFSVVNRQILFRPKGIYFQNKKVKKDTPTRAPTPIRRFTDTQQQQLESLQQLGILQNDNLLYK